VQYKTWLPACRDFLRAPQAAGGFTVRFNSSTPPPANATCDVVLPVHLRHEWPFGTQSIGHLIRDNLQALVEVPLQFGLNSAGFSWVTWPREAGNRPHELTHVMCKYSRLVSARPSFKWGQMVEKCEQGLLGAGACAPAVAPSGNMWLAVHASAPRFKVSWCKQLSAWQANCGRAAAASLDRAWLSAGERRPGGAVRYVRLQNVLASGASMDWTKGGDASRACARARFREMRGTAYRLFNVPHAPAAQQERVTLSVLVKTEKDKRQMLVPGATADAVRERFPGVDIDFHVAANEDLGVQLSWLSRTSIFLCNIGSPSFRMVFLPDGAQVQRPLAPRLLPNACCTISSCSLACDV
jgi:hypothetical protein